MTTIVNILLCTCQDELSSFRGTMTHFHDFHLKWSLKETDLTIHQEKMPCELINNITHDVQMFAHMRGNDITLCSGQGQLLLILLLLSHCKHMGSRHRKLSLVRITYLRINAMVFGIAVMLIVLKGSDVIHRQNAWIMTLSTFLFCSCDLSRKQVLSPCQT